MSSSALSSRPPSAEPTFDLDYSIHDFEVDPHRDSQFVFRRIEAAMLREGLLPGGRTLDVACGTGQLGVQITERGGEAWGIDASPEMLGISRWLYRPEQIVLVRGIAESLPYRDGSFDRVICQGALDHFVAPRRFMDDASRVLRPNGRLVLALANYESLSCRLGRALSWVTHAALGRPATNGRPYFIPPPDHFHRGTLGFVQQLGGPKLELERCYGISLLWLLRGFHTWTWGKTLDRLPAALAEGILRSLDGLGRRAPAHADMIVSVWRHRRMNDGR
jgi:SAM-dependent methyltransferase